MEAQQKKLKIALVQLAMVWEDAQANRDLLTQKILGIRSEVDLIILPEMFNSGFTMNVSKVAESMEGTTVSWMQNMALQKNAALVGSIAILASGKYYNRLLFVTPPNVGEAEKVVHYDKRHLFTLAKEDRTYSAGTNPLIVNYKGWRIKPLICYDLRFPVWSRNTENFDLLLYVANWPETRILAWDTLLRARAIENVCYTAAVNRIGQDGSGHTYVGHSVVYDALGTPLTKVPEERDTIGYATLDKAILDTTRARFGFLEDRDDFRIT